MTERGYDVIADDGGVPIKAWTRGVPVEEAARASSATSRALPFIHKWVAAMPDVHWGIGATVGSVIPTVGAIIPAAVGVDIGCGMMAVRTTLTRERSARRPARGCARRSSARCRTAAPTTAAATTAARGSDAARARSARRGRALAPRLRRASSTKHPQLGRGERTSSTSARSAPATTSSRSASTRRTASGSCCTAARAASATAIGTLLHRAGEEGHAPLRSSTCRTRTSPTSRRAPSTSTTTSRRSSWAQDFATTNRELMMDAVVARGARGAGLPPFEARRRGGELPPQLRGARAPLRRRTCS